MEKLKNLKEKFMELSESEKFDFFEFVFEHSPKWDNINQGSDFMVHISQAFNSGKRAILNQMQDENNFMSSYEYFVKKYKDNILEPTDS